MNDELEKMGEAEDEGAKWLSDFIKNSSPTEKDFKKARIITSHRATQVRAHGAVTARDRVRFSFARVIANDPEKLAEYVKTSMPAGFAKLIEEKQL